VNEQYYLTVCTRGNNPQLEECIKTLVQLKFNSPHMLEVLVVINSERVDVAFPRDVIVIFEPHRGYSSVRNRAISAIPKEVNVIFLDDDEIPSVDWLDALVSAHLNHPEDVIAGPVYPEQGIDQTSYRSLASRKYSKFEDGSLMKQAPTANMLIPASMIQKGWIHFDPIFNLSGSEDTDLCFRLRNFGARIRFAKKAILFERQKPERFDPDYLKKRRMRDVCNYSLVIRRNSNAWKVTWRFTTLVARIIHFGIFGVVNSDARHELRVYSKSLRVLVKGIPETE